MCRGIDGLVGNMSAAVAAERFHRLVHELIVPKGTICCMPRFETGPLWVQAVDIAGEERGFFDVIKADGFLDQSVDTKAAAAVHWQAVFKRL